MLPTRNDGMTTHLNLQNDFPILQRQINGKRLVYLDSTASSLKPQAVIDAVSAYYSQYSANIFRGIYTISEEATQAYEAARATVAGFIHASQVKEIIFVRNATEAMNLVAATWGRQTIRKNDEIITGVMEHHANIVPWQLLAQEKGAKLLFADLTTSAGEEQLYQLISSRTKLVAITHISNVLGIINPIARMVAEIKKRNPACSVLVDGAQSVPHQPVDVQSLGCDFLAFSGHKMLGPTGIGVLWGKYSLLESMPPYQTGGEMIRHVSLEKTTFQDPPHRFEAGTPHIAGAIGLAAAVEYLQSVGMDTVRNHEKELVRYAFAALGNIPGLQIYGPDDPETRAGVIAFTVDTIHPHDLAQILDRDNICIRSGSHCAMPLHTHLGVTATARASFYIYTTTEDIDELVAGIKKAGKILKG